MTKRAKKRMGRPPLIEEERKSKNVVFRLDPGEVAALERRAIEEDIPKSEVIRKAIRKYLGLSTRRKS